MGSQPIQPNKQIKIMKYKYLNLLPWNLYIYFIGEDNGQYSEQPLIYSIRQRAVTDTRCENVKQYFLLLL